MTHLRFSLRQLLRNAGGTAVILVTMALVMGAMTLILAILKHQRTAWMPFPEPDSVVKIWQIGSDGSGELFPAAVFAEAANQIDGLEAVGAYGFSNPRVLTGRGEPKHLVAVETSEAVFKVTERPPIMGRVFSREEVESEAPVVMISEELWEASFERSDEIIGETVILNEQPWTVVGVMPDGMDENALFYGTDVWLPKDFRSPKEAHGFVTLVGRRRLEISPEELNAELATRIPPMLNALPSEVWNSGDVEVRAFRADKLPGLRIEGEQVFGLAIPTLIFGIAGFNVANILLGRMLARRHEFAVRFSLGASRLRVVGQLLFECILLMLLATGLGALAATWVGNWARTQGQETEFSAGGFGISFLVAIIIGLLVGVLPALRATRVDLNADLKDSGRGSMGGGRQRHRLRNLLVIGQIAMATALCLGAGLLVRSYLVRQSFEPSFDPEKLVRVSVSLNRETYPKSEERRLFCDQARERIAAIPGVEGVAVSSETIISRHPFTISFQLESDKERRENQLLGMSMVSPNFFELIQVPLLRGRSFEASEIVGTPPVMVVSQGFVDRYFSDREPLGQRVGISIEGNQQWFSIIGVVPNRPNLGMVNGDSPEAYLCYQQFVARWASFNFVALCRGNAAALGPAIREAVQAVDRNVPVNAYVPLADALKRAIERNLSGTVSVMVVGLFGLVMASLGVYGVVGCAVTERTHELGIRMALGAEKGDVLGMLLKQGMRYVGIGLVVGTLIGSAITFGMHEDMLYGIGPFDPLTYMTVLLVLGGSAMCATYIPAERATRIDPMQALRHE